MTPPDPAVSRARLLLAEARAAGLRPHLAPDGGLALVGKASPVLLAQLRAHKAELVALLRAEARDSGDPP